MRKLVYLLAIIATFGCSSKEVTLIKGKIENLSGVTVYLEDLKGGSGKIVDSCELGKSGKFRFKVSLKNPEYFVLHLDEGKTLTLIISPSERVFISADYDNLYTSKQITGSPNTERLNILQDSLRNVMSKLNILKTQYLSLQKSDTSASKNIVAEYDELRKNHKKFSQSFILADLKSLANIGALYQEYEKDDYIFSSGRDLQFFKLVTDSLTKYYPNVNMVQTLQQNYAGFSADLQKRRLLQMAPAPESTLPDLNLADKQGKLVSLRSLKGKLVLLTFWSIEQAESIENLQALKSVYNKYHNKGFEIYQVAIDQSVNDWVNAIKFEEITWVSVCDPQFPNSRTRFLYNVNTIPMNYLISRDQADIIDKNLSPAVLEVQLSQLLN